MDREQLKILILKDLKDGQEPKYQELDVDKNLFGEVVENMEESGLIKNSSVVRGGMGNVVQMAFLNHARITDFGLRYLEQNN
ncbi:YjcQ family protein [Gracilibacillus dipsosauri]|uniref:YjcQ family protein n=1 Tax=Gracilibacillus dipsosauri TaxID=178340 RepID=UPI002409CBD0